MEQIHHLSQVVRVVGDHDRRLDLVERKLRALAEDPQALKRDTEATLKESLEETPEPPPEGTLKESLEETPEPPPEGTKGTPAKKTTPAAKK